jgi:hypothetical protein
MWCSLIKYTYHKIFVILPRSNPEIEKNFWTYIAQIVTPSFSEIAPAVRKCALPTDDNADEQHDQKNSPKFAKTLL